MLKLMLLLAGLATLTHAQVQVIAETMGKGKTAVFVSTNALAVKDYTALSLSSAQVWYGLTGRGDVFAGVSETIALGQKQAAALFGGNFHLAKIKGISLSTFHVFSVPLHRRTDSCGTLWLASGIISKDLKRLIPYGGYAATVPLGRTQDKLFTPADTVHNFPVGVAIPKGKFLFFVEYDFGKKQQIGGLGVAYTF